MRNTETRVPEAALSVRERRAVAPRQAPGLGLGRGGRWRRTAPCGLSTGCQGRVKGITSPQGWRLPRGRRGRAEAPRAPGSSQSEDNGSCGEGRVAKQGGSPAPGGAEKVFPRAGEATNSPHSRFLLCGRGFLFGSWALAGARQQVQQKSECKRQLMQCWGSTAQERRELQTALARTPSERETSLEGLILWLEFGSRSDRAVAGCPATAWCRGSVGAAKGRCGPATAFSPGTSCEGAQSWKLGGQP